VGSYPNFETKELVIRCLGEDAARVESVVEIVRMVGGGSLSAPGRST